jgi:hypothetical protein
MTMIGQDREPHQGSRELTSRQDSDITDGRCHHGCHDLGLMVTTSLMAGPGSDGRTRQRGYKDGKVSLFILVVVNFHKFFSYTRLILSYSFVKNWIVIYFEYTFPC